MSSDGLTTDPQAPVSIDRAEGSRLFGVDPENYDAARPAYPGWVFQSLAERGALRPGTATVEIGPGNGLATGRLIEGGANPLTLIEPDLRFSDMLHNRIQTCQDAILLPVRFEEAALVANAFDLAFCATAFHWINPELGWAKLRRSVKTGGTVALTWNVFQNLHKPDAFHEATTSLFSGHSNSPANNSASIPYALDREAREKEARVSGFSFCAYRESHWTLTLDAPGVVQLYNSFSNVRRLSDTARSDLLRNLHHIAEHSFSGCVERHVTTALYCFQ